MTSRRLLAWCLLAVWTVWAVALQSLLTADAAPNLTWVPQMAPVIFLALASRLETRDLPIAALVVALARAACGLEPPASVLFGLLVLAGFVRVLRGVLELDGPATRAVLAGLTGLALACWFDLVHTMRLGFPPGQGLATVAWHTFLPTALATALAALLLAPAIRRLPGLSPLWERRKSAW
jgi:hypothetical protein